MHINLRFDFSSFPCCGWECVWETVICFLVPMLCVGMRMGDCYLFSSFPCCAWECILEQKKPRWSKYGPDRSCAAIGLLRMTSFPRSHTLFRKSNMFKFLQAHCVKRASRPIEEIERRNSVQLLFMLIVKLPPYYPVGIKCL